MKTQGIIVITAGLLGAGALLAGCADTGDGSAGSPPGGSASGGPASEESGDPAELMTAESEVGTILVDGAGRTLYLFTPDARGPSTCVDDCLAMWPAVEGTPTAGEGVDEALLGTGERDDGTVQATYNDWPLYYFVQDTEPGDVTGQGLNEVWYVLTPEGEAITEAPEPTSGTGRGY